MPTPFVLYDDGTVITADDLNAVREAINDLEAWQLQIEVAGWTVGVLVEEAPDGARETFSLPEAYVSGTVQISCGLPLVRDLHWEEGPGPDEITILLDPPLQVGDHLLATYVRAST